MKTTAIRITVGAILMTLCLFVPTPNAAADEFVEPSPMARLAQGLNPANWRMPQWRMPDLRSLLPGNEEKARIKKKQDSFLDEVTQTASNSWNRTKQVFSPQNLSPMRFFPASARTPSKTEPKPGFFRSMLMPRQETQDSSNNDSSVIDFLGRSRPGQ